MSHHAPRGRIKARPSADPMATPDPMADRCSAHSKQSGNRCKQPAIAGGTVCRYHGGSAPQVIKAAKERLLELQGNAVDALQWLVGQKEYPSAAYAAARDILDRTDGKPVETVNQHHKGALRLIHEAAE